MESSFNQNSSNGSAVSFELIHDYFGEDFGGFSFEALGHGYEMYFNNSIHVLRVGNCRVRVVCDRGDHYVEVAESSAPETYRQKSAPNLWFDLSVLIPYLENITRFSWFYDYPDFLNDSAEKVRGQLAYLAEKTRPYWPDIINFFGTPKYQDQKEALFKHREKWASSSWDALGWDGARFSGQKKSPALLFNFKQEKSKKMEKIVLGHFPEFMDRAQETSSSFLGIIPQIWVGLGRDELRWAVTKQFLDNVLKAHSAVALATELRSPKSFFAREVEYLVSMRKAG